jgi:hypothetical protein
VPCFRRLKPRLWPSSPGPPLCRLPLDRRLYGPSQLSRVVETVFWLDRRRGEEQYEADLAHRLSQVHPHLLRSDAASDADFVGLDLNVEDCSPGAVRLSRQSFPTCKRACGDAVDTAKVNYIVDGPKRVPRMANNLERLEAELEALALWDRLYLEIPTPDTIDKDACMARIFRRVQVIVELGLAGR